MSASDPQDIEGLLATFRSSLSQVSPPPSSLRLAQSTLQLLKRLIAESNWRGAQDLMDSMRSHLGPLAATEPLVGNLVRRVLKLIREDSSSALKSSSAEEQQSDAQESLQKMMTLAEDTKETKKEASADLLRPQVLESVEELLTELESAAEEISCQALEHIHANEVILTIGRSRTVELFLRQAAKERKFHVIVAECAPFYHGHEMAANLAKTSKIQTTVITDSAIFAVMSRVNKVIIGTGAILADGGLRAVTGSYTVALAAKHFSVPLYVCASMFKLTPQYYTSGDQEAFCKFVSPQESARGMDGKILSLARAVTPVFEYVPPGLVTLFISNVSGYAPSYVYRLLSELYHPKDYDLNSSCLLQLHV